MRGNKTLKNATEKSFIKKGLRKVLLLSFAILFIAPIRADAIIHDSIQEGLKNFFLEWIGSAIASIVTFVLAVLNWFIGIVTWLVKEIVDWMIEFSLSVPYTSGPVIDSTWPVVRDLANMGLVLVLVAIGIGTILNLKQGAYRKRLGAFFLIALLINFTPVITGVVIDMSNIAARVFYDSAVNSPSALMSFGPGAAFDTAGDNFGDAWSAMEAVWSDEKNFNDTVAIIIKAIAGVTFNIMLLFLFILLAVLFLARVLFLWLLVVLSPLAFLFYILPSTKKWFDRWWHNFFQWSFIVVPLLFFLWMAGLFANNGKTVCTSSLDRSDLTYYNSEGASFTEEAICSAANGVLAAITLFAGIVISLHSSAEGARVVTAKTKVLSLAASKKMGRGLERTAYGQGRIGRGIRSAAKKVPGAETTARRVQQQLRQFNDTKTGRALSAAGTVTGVKAGSAAVQRKASNRRAQIMGEWEKKYKKEYSTPEVAVGALSYERDPERRAYIMDYLAKERPQLLHGYYENLEPAEKEEFMKGVEQREKMYTGSSRSVKKIFPHTIEDKQEREKTISMLSAKDISNVHHEAFENTDFVDNLLQNPSFGKRGIHETMKHPKKKDLLVERFIEDRGEDGLKDVAKAVGPERARQLYRDLSSSPGGAAALREAEVKREKSEKEIKAKEKLANIDQELSKINSSLNSGLSIPDRTKAEYEAKKRKLEKEKEENEDILKDKQPKSILGWAGSLVGTKNSSSISDPTDLETEERMREEMKEEAKKELEEEKEESSE